MNFMEQAQELALEGFYVFPLLANSKLPAIKDFSSRATRDPDQIKKFWTDPVLGVGQSYNIGIMTTKYNGSQALVVVDVDDKNNKCGSDRVVELELEGFDFIETATQKTPTGGRHLIYKTKIAVKQGTNVLAKGLDIRSKGGYIVAAGSVIDGVSYQFENNTEPAECPQWILDKCGTAYEKDLTLAPKEINQDRALSRAQFYLTKEAPISVEGDAGDETAFKVAAHVKDMGVSELNAYPLMLDYWNERCTPPWSPEELKKKISNAYAYGALVPGSKAPEHDFTTIGEITEENFLEVMNKHYAVVFSEGECFILFETVDEKGQPKREFLRETAFKRKFSPYTIQQGKGQARSYADIWLDWQGRRQYQGLCFKPELEANNNYFNLWRGFSREAVAFDEATPSAKLGFEMFIDHAKTNVCEDDEKLFTWLMGYFAHLIQKPYEKPQVTLVFRGQKGVGKNVIVDRVGELLGSGHYLVAHDGRYLTSNFNGHLDSCLCLVLDEAFWSGDKKAEGKLKGLSTSPTVLIERKGKEPYMVDNYVRLIIIGNEEWLVPASYDERRYAVLDVGEGKKQDQVYFSKLVSLMDKKGGAEILLHYLRNFDLKTVNVNKAPQTRALAEQKIESLGALEKYWHQCLLEGRIEGGDFTEGGWPERMSKEDFRRGYSRYCKEDLNMKSWTQDRVHVSRSLKKICPGVDVNQKLLKEKGGYRERCFIFPELEEAREDWSKRFDMDEDWD